MVPREFGLYGIGFAVLMVLIGFWQGFFITQYIVLASKQDQTTFPAHVYATMALVSGCAGLGVILAAAVLEYVWDAGLIVLAIGFAAILFSFKEFHIRYALSVGRKKEAVLVNMLMAAGLVVFIVFQSASQEALKAETAFVWYTLIVLLAAFGGHIASGLSLSGLTRADLFGTLQKLAVGGRWAVATNIIASFRINAHVIMLAVLLDPTAVAFVNAGRLFLTPLILLIPALSNVVLPYFARVLHRDGSIGLWQNIRRIGAAALILVGLYSLVLLMAWPFIEPLLVGDQYQGLAPILAMWCIFTAVLMIRSIFDWGVQSERRFSLLAKISVGVTLFALLTAWQLTLALGTLGAIGALVLSELVMAVAFWFTLRTRN